MRKTKFLTGLTLALMLAVTGCAGGTDTTTTTTTASGETEASTAAQGESTQAAEAGSFIEEQKGITVELTTDKTDYSEGEEVNFTLTVVNGREGYTITQTYLDYYNSGLTTAEGCDLPAKIKALPAGESATIEGRLVGTGEKYTGVVQSSNNATGVETITIRPYVYVNYGGEQVMVRIIVSMNMVQKQESIDRAYQYSAKTVSCHDPSIFKDTDGTYYIFGTHLVMASSTDLINWTDHTYDFRMSFTEETRALIKEWNADNTADSWYGYLWAPDVIYNENLGKYCMYLSANGDSWISNIVMLTADTVTGPYSYAGTVVYGGFTSSTWGSTDVADVLGVSELPQRYITNGVENRKWGDEYPNCIDPCVLYDDDGNLWMSYGSWSGGIFMLKLDNNTGLRDTSVSYETNAHSDAYFGQKIAGGKYVSGEASYIQKVGDYYYLFISYGNLEAAGGYNMRIFRSETINGPYVDALGNSAFYDKYEFNYNQSIGVRLMGGYKWRFSSVGQVAQGHNSAFVDDDGNAYVVYHTRTNNGSEMHYVKVHRLVVNEDGWILALPFQTHEDSDPGSVAASEIAGKYDVILHELDIDYKNLEVKVPEIMTLNEDGTISGTFTGSWTYDEATGYAHITIGDVEYHGVFVKQYIETSTLETVVFTALGVENQLTLWGSKRTE
ncbi:MAG: glycoside hydrolase family 43 protein [Lachnospiraceae bacterium]|nr:glycoside hydrolase family 43 protein [Lachnospiraceae bacterium]